MKILIIQRMINLYGGNEVLVNVAFMLFPIAGISEAPVAKLTRIRFNTGVGIHMLLQVFLGGAPFSTDITWQAGITM